MASRVTQRAGQFTFGLNDTASTCVTRSVTKDAMSFDLIVKAVSLVAGLLAIWGFIYKVGWQKTITALTVTLVLGICLWHLATFLLPSVLPDFEWTYLLLLGVILLWAYLIAADNPFKPSGAFHFHGKRITASAGLLALFTLVGYFVISPPPSLLAEYGWTKTERTVGALICRPTRSLSTQPMFRTY